MPPPVGHWSVQSGCVYFRLSSFSAEYGSCAEGTRRTPQRHLAQFYTLRTAHRVVRATPDSIILTDDSMPSGKKRKRAKIAKHKRKKRLRKNRHKKK